MKRDRGMNDLDERSRGIEIRISNVFVMILTLPMLMGSATEHGEGKDVYG